MDSKFDIRDKLFRIEDVSELTTYSKSAIWSKVAKRQFPAPFKLPSSSISLWRGSELFDWIESCSANPISEK